MCALSSLNSNLNSILHVETRVPILLAPMASVTDLPYREICHEHGCCFSYTEMVSAKGLFYGNKHTEELLAWSNKASPCGVQVFGSEPNIIAEMCAGINDKYGENVSLIDINMGCPAPKIVKNGEGSALMKNIPLASRIIKAAVRASSLPITVKFRKGWDASSINAVEFALMAQDSGAAAVTVHGRTRVQMYSGKSDREIIAKIKSRLSIPVIGNGDIFNRDDAVSMLHDTGCDGIMVARGAQGNPFLFEEIHAFFANKEYTPPTPKQRVLAALRHLEKHISIKGEGAFVQMRKHIAWYTKGLQNGARLRVKINQCANATSAQNILLDFLQSDLTE